MACGVLRSSVREWAHAPWDGSVQSYHWVGRGVSGHFIRFLKIDLIELFIYYGSFSLFLCSVYHILILRTQLRIWGAGFGGEWIHVHVWLSLFAVYLKPPQHCLSATPQYKVKSLNSEKEKEYERSSHSNWLNSGVLVKALYPWPKIIFIFSSGHGLSVKMIKTFQICSIQWQVSLGMVGLRSKLKLTGLVTQLLWAPVFSLVKWDQ